MQNTNIFLIKHTRIQKVQKTAKLHCLFLCNISLNVFFFCRAPVLVAVALIESGMKYEDAIQFIRQYVHLS